VGSILAVRFVAIFALLRRRLGRSYRRNAEPHVTLAQTQVRERTPFEEKSLKMPHRGPNFGDVLCRRAPLPAAWRRAWADGGYLGVLEGEEPLLY